MCLIYFLGLLVHTLFLLIIFVYSVNQDHIKYLLDLIQESVLIGNVESYIREINGLKNGMNRIKELETINKELEGKVDDLTNTVKSMSKFVLMLNQSFKESHDKDDVPDKDDVITVTDDEIKDFLKLVKKLYEQDK